MSVWSIPFLSVWFVCSSLTGFLSYWYFWGSELFHVFVDKFHCKTKKFICGTSQRMVPMWLCSWPTYISYMHHCSSCLVLLNSGCSILNRYLMPDGSALLPCIWQRIFSVVYWAMSKPRWIRTSWDFGLDSQMLLIYISLQKCHCFKIATGWSGQNNVLCKYLLGCISCHTERQLQLCDWMSWFWGFLLLGADG